jgi:hypothetical protein
VLLTVLDPFDEDRIRVVLVTTLVNQVRSPSMMPDMMDDISGIEVLGHHHGLENDRQVGLVTHQKKHPIKSDVCRCLLSRKERERERECVCVCVARDIEGHFFGLRWELLGIHH